MVLTKKDLLETIEDMPMDAPIKAVIRLDKNRSIVVPNLKVDIYSGTIRFYNKEYEEC